ncbi:hypothetical protein JW848_09400 [Candidatus Bipolaricaulota bacterium]|nr:hypothetical protein [Candidatus Bipolaricaulota bacterium]
MITPKDEKLTVEQRLLSYIEPFQEHGWITRVIAQVKSGKEATIFCCEAHPDSGHHLLAAKVYRPYDMRSFKNDAVYQRGRQRAGKADMRTLRALEGKSKGGRNAKFQQWVSHEAKTLKLLSRAGADVPQPIAQIGPAILMSYIGDEERPAPMLYGLLFDRHEAEILLDRLIHNVELFLRHHRIHADLSPYNILYWEDKPVIIDFPQAVDPRFNETAEQLLARDIRYIAEFVGEFGVEYDAERMTSDLWRRYRTARL